MMEPRKLPESITARNQKSNLLLANGWTVSEGVWKNDLLGLYRLDLDLAVSAQLEADYTGGQ